MKSMLIEYKEVQVLVPTYPVVNCYAEDYKPTVAEMILVPSMVYPVPMMKIREPTDVVVVVEANDM